LLLIRQFKRVKQGLDAVVKDRRSKIDLTELLESYLASTDRRLDELAKEIEAIIQVAIRAETTGKDINTVLKIEQKGLLQRDSEESLWTKLVLRRGFVGQRFQNDLKLTQKTIDVISTTVNDLRDLQIKLVEYQANVKTFQVSHNCTWLMW
jgi:hypothetical protein